MQSVFISVIGRTNVGKSSLVNLFIGEKVAIVTPKPQTTRNKITGVITCGELQYVFFDTPGLHRVRSKLGERMTGYAARALTDGDVILAMFAPCKKFSEEELSFIEKIKNSNLVAIAALNKCDLLTEEEIAQQCERIEGTGAFKRVFCISVQDSIGTDELFSHLATYSVFGEDHFYPEDSFTDLPKTAFVCETVREKMLILLREEIPHGVAVCCERYTTRASGMVDIDIDIICEKQSHKGIIIGKGGQTLKAIASGARLDLEEFLNQKINLKCFVKVREGWRDSDTQLKNFGFSR